MSTSHQQQQQQPQRADAEKSVGRNPHPDFKAVEASRPDWTSTVSPSSSTESGGGLRFTKTKDPNWRPGQGATDGGESVKKEHVGIDPYAEGRPAVFNYKLLISAIVPRPIGFVSTRSEDGKSTNLSPFSYFQVINHDPPLFIFGFAGGLNNSKDTLRNILSTRECAINIISDHFLEAANATAINAPFGHSEWPISGLTPAPSEHVKPDRVKEAVFSVEAKLVSHTEFESKATPGKKTGVLVVVEGIKFWAREDAVNEERNLIDPSVLRPMSRMGGITYGRTSEAVEIPRPDWEEELGWLNEKGLVKGKLEGQ